MFKLPIKRDRKFGRHDLELDSKINLSSKIELEKRVYDLPLRRRIQHSCHLCDDGIRSCQKCMLLKLERREVSLTFQKKYHE